jgi:dihydroorotate dehydrogenase
MVIGVGGLMTPEDAVARQKTADLLQVYSGWIYEGPHLLERMVRALKEANVS